MALQVSKDIQNLANAAEERRKREEQGIDPEMLGGLGLGAAGFAAQTGRTPAPTPPPKLSPLAQKIAAQDAAKRQATQTASTAAKTAARGPLMANIGSKAVPVLGAATTGYTVGSLLEGATGGAPSSFVANLLTGGEYGSPKPLPPFSEEEISNRRLPDMSTVANQPMTPEGRNIFQEIVRSPVTLGERIGEFIGRQKYGTGISAEGDITGRPLPEATLPAQAATLAAGGAELYEATGRGLEKGLGSALEYATAQDIIRGGPVETPAPELAEAPTMTPPAPEAVTTAPESVTAVTAAPEVSTAQQNFLARQQQGTPLTAQEIAAAKRFATSQGQIFDPEKGYVPAEFYGQQYVGQSIGDYLRGADTPAGATEQFVDPQGRLRRRMAGTDQLAPEYASYEAAAEGREARLMERERTMERELQGQRGGQTIPESARTQDVGQLPIKYSDSQLRDMVGGGDALKRAKALQDAGRDPLTGQPVGMTPYQEATLEQNQQRIDFAKEQAEEARRTALAKGATQAQKDAFELKQKELNYAMTYQNFLKDQESPAFDAKDIEADLEGIEDQLDIVYDPEAGVFRKRKTVGKGEVIRLDDPKNASIVRTIGTYKVGKALLDRYPKKG